MTDWQPIETAPKDGTAILIYLPRGGDGPAYDIYMPESALMPGEHSYYHDDPRALRFDDKRFAIGYWRPWGSWGNRNESTVEPTHWMPLPEPPRP